MQVSRDGIRNKSLLLSAHRIAKPEAAASMAHIKNDAAGASLLQGGIDFSIGKNNGKLLSEHVSVNVARSHLFQDQVLVSSLRSRPEIKHDGNIRERAAFNGAVNRSPGDVLRIPRLLRPVVGGFYSDDEVRVSFDGGGAKLGVHLVQALLEPAAHAIRHDVQKSEHSHFRSINDFFFFH